MRLQPEVLAQSGISSETGIVRQSATLSRVNSLDVQLTSDRIHLMAKTLIQSVVTQLQKERARLENELHGVTAALTTFGKVFLRGSKGSRRGASAHPKKRTISAAGRKRIAAAQRARWARVRAAKKK
jgi:hypothetical protein